MDVQPGSPAAGTDDVVVAGVEVKMGDGYDSMEGGVGYLKEAEAYQNDCLGLR